MNLSFTLLLGIFPTTTAAFSVGSFSTRASSTSSSALFDHDIRRPTIIGPDSLGGVPFYRTQQATKTPDDEWWIESRKFHWSGQQGQGNRFFAAPQPGESPVMAERASFQNASFQNAGQSYPNEGQAAERKRRGPFSQAPTLVGPDTLGGRARPRQGAGGHRTRPVQCPGPDEWWNVANDFHWTK